MARSLDPVHHRQELVDMTAFTTRGEIVMHGTAEVGRGKTISGVMALATLIQRWNMIQRFSGCYAAGMARPTIIGVNAKVVIHNPGKAVEIVHSMTARAIRAGWHMIDRLAYRDASIMAQGAITGIYARMVKRGGHEGRRVVTGAAILGGRQMINALAKADHIIVTGRTGRRAEITRVMNKRSRGKSTGTMTNPAIVTG